MDGISFMTIVVWAVAALGVRGLGPEAIAAEPGSAELPMQYIGPGLADQWAADGGLRYSPGVQNIQLSRANRKHPPHLSPEAENRKGWTYQHHVGIGCWKGRLYAVWDMTHKDEDVPPCHLVYSTSADGFHWTQPRDLFPYGLGWNLRFYFYRASNGRMLAFACGAYPTEKISEAEKRTLLVREITADHRLGPVYTLINPGPAYPPIYTTSRDHGFVAACREACNNRPLLEQQDYGVFLGDRRMKWHDGRNWPDGRIGGAGSFWVFGKAFCFFHRRDGVLVGLCKMGWVTLSYDEGETWTLPVIPPTIEAGSGKAWAQRTPDGRYAMVYIPQRHRRFPMAVTTSDDGVTFRDMRVIHGEVPPQRYAGEAKGGGPQYLRGVAEWAGDAASLDQNSIWVIYSVNKEDIWVSRIPVPIVAETRKGVDDTFDDVPIGPRVPGWNTYSPIWAPVSVAADRKGRNHYLQLEDREPADYARAIRTFPPSRAADISFAVSAAQADRGKLKIELLGESGRRPVRIIFNEKGQIQYVQGQEPPQAGPVTDPFAAGLAGTYFNNMGFEDPEDSVDLLLGADHDWGSSRGSDWCARWSGFIEGPCTGEVTFTAEANDGLRVKIGDKILIDSLSENGPRRGKVAMQKGVKAPIVIEFCSSRGKAALRLFWQWQGRPREIVPPEALSHDVRKLPKDYRVFDFHRRFEDEKPEKRAAGLMAYRPDTWYRFRIRLDCTAGKYSVAVNGRQLLEDAWFAESSPMVYAVSFRTGLRTDKNRNRLCRVDLPGTEEPVPAVVYRVDNVRTENLQCIN